MTTTPTPEQLRTHYRPIRSVPVSCIRPLYEVFAACHDNASLDAFMRDLGSRTGIVMMTRPSDGRIVGYAMLDIRRAQVDGRTVIALLSDDAVTLPDHWAQCDLAAGVRQQLLKTKLRHPQTPLYWCQLARHHRSHLLMAGHAKAFHPGPKDADAALGRAARALGRQFFPEGFDEQRMLLAPPVGHAARPNQATLEITPAMRHADRRLAQFRKHNPDWQGGTALLSVAVFDAPSALASLRAGAWGWVRRHILRNYRPAGSGPRSEADSRQHASWRDSSLDEALERGETS